MMRLCVAMCLLAACAPPPVKHGAAVDEVVQRPPAEELEERRRGACTGPIDEPARPKLVEPAAVAEGFIGTLEIEGLARVSKERVLGAIKTAAGSALDADQLASDVEALWSLDELDDVAVHVRGATDDLTVVMTLHELPLVGRVFVAGDSDARRLAGELTAAVRVERPYQRHHANAQAHAIEDALVDRGHGRAKVELRRRRPEPGVVDLCFVVIPGPVVVDETVLPKD